MATIWATKVPEISFRTSPPKDDPFVTAHEFSLSPVLIERHP
jgi:hypothetical protein